MTRNSIISRPTQSTSYDSQFRSSQAKNQWKRNHRPESKDELSNYPEYRNRTLKSLLLHASPEKAEKFLSGLNDLRMENDYPKNLDIGRIGALNLKNLPMVLIPLVITALLPGAESARGAYYYSEVTPMPDGDNCAILSVYPKQLDAHGDCPGALDAVQTCGTKIIQRNNPNHKYAHSESTEADKKFDHCHIAGNVKQLRCAVRSMNSNEQSHLPHSRKSIFDKINKACNRGSGREL